MKIVDNFDTIKEMLSFESSDDFYFMQIIKRRKDNPDMETGSLTIKSYYISSVEYLERKKEDIISSCNKHNARASINLNKKSFEKTAYTTLKLLSNALYNKQYDIVKSIYDKAASESNSDSKNKTWVIDLDKEHVDNIVYYIHFIESSEPIKDKFFTKINTPNGIHLIAEPFNVSAFNKLCENHKLPIPDIHKNNPTILYFNKLY